MKNLFIGLSLAAALLTASCTTDTTNDILLGAGEQGVAGNTKTIKVGINNEISRIYTGDEENGRMAIYCSEGDVMEINGSALRTSAITEDFDGLTTAEIEIPADTTYPLTLLFPAAVSKDNVEYFYVPGEQSYNPNALANGYAVMMGYAEAEGDEIAMQHTCGYFNVALTGNTTVTKVMLRAVNHEPLSGFFIPSFGAEGNTAVEYTQNNLSDGYYNSTVITINCGDGVDLSSEPTEFCFAIPAGTYAKGFELTVLNSLNKQQTVTAYANGKEVNAGTMIKMPALAVNCDKAVGIYSDNAFIGYIRSVEKDCWLDNDDTLNLRSDVSLSNFDRSDIARYSCLINYRSDYATYNNDDMKVFDGHNFAICDYSNTITTNKDGLIFDTIDASWTIQNLKIGKTAGKNADVVATFAIDNTPGYNYAGVLCFEVNGKLKNCVNNATTNFVFSGGNGVRFGVFSGNGDNVDFTIEDCTNNGDIIYTEAEGVTPPPSGKAIQLGGIAARSMTTALKRCKNTGNITITTNAKGNLQIGGIVGQSNVTTDSGHENSGNITITANGVGYSHIGGIHGYSKGVSYSKNNGTINATISGQNDVVRVAGIVGSLASGAIDNCQNLANGSIIVNAGVKSSKWCAVGGIVGYGSSESATPLQMTNCINYGAINYSGLCQARVGGITGMTGGLTNCTNYGEIKQTNADCTSEIYVGGIGGSLHFSYTNINNYGNVSAVGTGTKCYAGGFAGYTTGTDASVINKSYTNCNADCTVTAPAAGCGGILFGQTASAVLSLSNCKVYGKVVLAGVETVVNSDNYTELLRGAAADGAAEISCSNVTIESTKQ